MATLAKSYLVHEPVYYRYSKIPRNPHCTKAYALHKPQRSTRM